MHYNESMSGKSFISVLTFLLLVTGCAPSSYATAGVPSATLPASMPLTADIPKQNQLIFIEFFAVT
jgi:hypothetical protein